MHKTIKQSVSLKYLSQTLICGQINAIDKGA